MWRGNEPTDARSDETLPPGRGEGAGERVWLPRGERSALVVDNRSIVRLVVCLYLRKLGYRAYGAESAPAATRMQDTLCAEPLHLLVTDVLPPGMTGPELAMRLRDRAPGLRVLYMSAEPDRESYALGSGTDRARLLRKPFTLMALAVALHKLDLKP